MRNVFLFETDHLGRRAGRKALLVGFSPRWNFEWFETKTKETGY